MNKGIWIIILYEDKAVFEIRPKIIHKGNFGKKENAEANISK